ncbi:MAG: transglutaminase family protein [Mariniblastus sp.]
MNKTPILILLIVLLIGQADAFGFQEIDSKENWVHYDVTVTTDLTIPADNHGVVGVKILHALPTPRQWTGHKRKPGATKISWNRKIGRKVYDKRKESHHILYQFKRGLSAGSKLEVTTNFLVKSKDRSFDPEASTANWHGYKKAKVECEKPKHDIELLGEVVAGIKKENRPGQTVAEFCRWISGYLTYDSAVAHKTSDVAKTIELRRGHCGHYFEVLAEMCREAGIPVRRVFGMNLYATDGVTSPHTNIRVSFTNTHTWGEVYIPGHEWVEVEPANRRNMFQIPARYIQNNRWFQNSLIWIDFKNVKFVKPKLTVVDGAVVSDYADSTIKSFKIVEPEDESENKAN